MLRRAIAPPVRVARAGSHVAQHTPVTAAAAAVVSARSCSILQQPQRSMSSNASPASALEPSVVSPAVLASWSAGEVCSDSYPLSPAETRVLALEEQAHQIQTNAVRMHTDQLLLLAELIHMQRDGGNNNTAEGHPSLMSRCDEALLSLYALVRHDPSFPGHQLTLADYRAIFVCCAPQQSSTTTTAAVGLLRHAKPFARLLQKQCQLLQESSTAQDSTLFGVNLAHVTALAAQPVPMHVATGMLDLLSTGRFNLGGPTVDAPQPQVDQNADRPQGRALVNSLMTELRSLQTQREQSSDPVTPLLQSAAHRVLLSLLEATPLVTGENFSVWFSYGEQMHVLNACTQFDLPQLAVRFWPRILQQQQAMTRKARTQKAEVVAAPSNVVPPALLLKLMACVSASPEHGVESAARLLHMMQAPGYRTRLDLSAFPQVALCDLATSLGRNIPTAEQLQRASLLYASIAVPCAWTHRAMYRVLHAAQRWDQADAVFDKLLTSPCHARVVDEKLFIVAAVSILNRLEAARDPTADAVLLQRADMLWTSSRAMLAPSPGLLMNVLRIHGTAGNVERQAQLLAEAVEIERTTQADMRVGQEAQWLATPGCFKLVAEAQQAHKERMAVEQTSWSEVAADASVAAVLRHREAALSPSHSLRVALHALRMSDHLFSIDDVESIVALQGAVWDRAALDEYMLCCVDVPQAPRALHTFQRAVHTMKDTPSAAAFVNLLVCLSRDWQPVYAAAIDALRASLRDRVSAPVLLDVRSAQRHFFSITSRADLTTRLHQWATQDGVLAQFTLLQQRTLQAAAQTAEATVEAPVAVTVAEPVEDIAAVPTFERATARRVIQHILRPRVAQKVRAWTMLGEGNGAAPVAAVATMRRTSQPVVRKRVSAPVFSELPMGEGLDSSVPAWQAALLARESAKPAVVTRRRVTHQPAAPAPAQDAWKGLHAFLRYGFVDAAAALDRFERDVRELGDTAGSITFALLFRCMTTQWQPRFAAQLIALRTQMVAGIRPRRFTAEDIETMREPMIKQAETAALLRRWAEEDAVWLGLPSGVRHAITSAAARVEQVAETQAVEQPVIQAATVAAEPAEASAPVEAVATAAEATFEPQVRPLLAAEVVAPSLETVLESVSRAPLSESLSSEALQQWRVQDAAEAEAEYDLSRPNERSLRHVAEDEHVSLPEQPGAVDLRNWFASTDERTAESAQSQVGVMRAQTRSQRLLRPIIEDAGVGRSERVLWTLDRWMGGVVDRVFGRGSGDSMSAHAWQAGAGMPLY